MVHGGLTLGKRRSIEAVGMCLSLDDAPARRLSVLEANGILELIGTEGRSGRLSPEKWTLGSLYLSFHVCSCVG